MSDKWKLDECYFNRAGDKIRFVGYSHPSYKFYFRQEKDGQLYQVDDLGFVDEGRVSHPGDIMFKWEITDDPDRVYIMKGIGYRYDSMAIKYGGLIEVEKILIKPLNLMPGKIEYVELKKKIEPLDKWDTLSLKSKINEIIEVLNAERI